MSKERELQLGMRCVKYMIFVANFMFMLVGFLLISIGYTIKAIYTDFDAFLTNHTFKASDLAIGVGVVILIVALFGCVGAVRQSVFLVNLYALCLLLIVVLEIAVSIAAYRSRAQLEITLEADMYTSMNEYQRETNFIWSASQRSLRCCGVNGPDDWAKYEGRYNMSYVTEIRYSTGKPKVFVVPDSCCRQNNCTDIYSLRFTGCLPKINYIISQSALLLGVGAMCITFIQLLGAIFAHLLARSIRKLKTQMEVERSIRRQQLYEQLSQAQAQSEQAKVSPVLYVPSSSEA
ncbi:unnamed protein product [Psylliodes chrysocephalus]|uniref:Tetraspanin n=1 Tax=Psylliodes chrysocephalus TaxID=3402493 RepID=A0A9P0CMH4_9CUCU|nr:unnamed protein product [Psylliodes chrysocephala]